MNFSVYAHNILDGFSQIDTGLEYINNLHDIQPDIAIFSEAYRIGKEDLLPAIIKNIADLGYTVVYGPYDDLDKRSDAHGILLAIRQGRSSQALRPRLVRIGGRYIAECWLMDEASGEIVHFLGMHLNDRSEAKRQAELNDLMRLIADEPTVLAGDLNSLHRPDASGLKFIKARVIRRLVKMKLWPISEPTGQPEPMTLARRGSLNFRLAEMASGKTLARLLQAGFRDADAHHTPTYPARHPQAQLDHILLSRHCTVRDFTVLPVGHSDHQGIVAQIEMTGSGRA